MRAEIIENQLDDRHDLGGNTVYHLNFDASILPVGKTEASAIIEVHVLKSDTTERPATKKGSVGSQVTREQYSTWLKETLTAMNDTLTKRVEDASAAISSSLLPATGNTPTKPTPIMTDQLRQDLQKLKDHLVPVAGCERSSEEVLKEISCSWPAALNVRTCGRRF